MAQIKAEKLALRFNETTVEIMMKAPDSTPAPPRPAIARPMMNMAEVLAAPQRREPISKRANPNRKTHLWEYDEYSFPKKSWKPAIRVNMGI
jgi:hypothetical protein